MATRPVDLLLGRLTRKAVAAPPVAAEGSRALTLLKAGCRRSSSSCCSWSCQLRPVVHPEPGHEDDDLRPLRGEHEHPLGLRRHPQLRPRRLLRLRRLRVRHPHHPRRHLQFLAQPAAGHGRHRAARRRARHPGLPRVRRGGLRQPDLLPAGHARVRGAPGTRGHLARPLTGGSTGLSGIPYPDLGIPGININSASYYFLVLRHRRGLPAPDLPASSTRTTATRSAASTTTSGGCRRWATTPGSTSTRRTSSPACSAASRAACSPTSGAPWSPATWAWR